MSKDNVLQGISPEEIRRAMSTVVYGKNRNAERNHTILSYRLDGVSVEDCASKFKLSPDRVRQIEASERRKLHSRVLKMRQVDRYAAASVSVEAIASAVESNVEVVNVALSHPNLCGLETNMTAKEMLFYRLRGWDIQTLASYYHISERRVEETLAGVVIGLELATAGITTAIEQWNAERTTWDAVAVEYGVTVQELNRAIDDDAIGPMIGSGGKALLRCWLDGTDPLDVASGLCIEYASLSSTLTEAKSHLRTRLEMRKSVYFGDGKPKPVSKFVRPMSLG